MTAGEEKAAVRAKVGRPSVAQAKLRHEELLDRSLDLFLENGFELTTTDAIAAALGMSKRTVYSLYPDKNSLFLATVQRAIERWRITADDLRSLETEDLEQSLLAIARLRASSLVSPAGYRLQQIVYAGYFRFPNMFAQAFEQGTRPAIAYIADLLSRHAQTGAIEAPNPELLAEAFLNLVVGGFARSLAGGVQLKTETTDERIQICVKLFLNGIRPR